GGGAGGAGGGGGNRSDIRLKREIAVIGKLPNGLKLYKFKYLWSNVEWVGVMAQDVLKVAPEAVITGKDGFYRVRYDLLGTAMKTFDQWQAEMARIEDLPLAA
ncbi:MAG: tail fiber domain-containing protein, partial [Hyphomicrobiales bacterium]|nr:tail fiber domain-containing protein [Hyphomicrobiales bacterium]